MFVALFDYDPMSMSPNPDAADEELPFKEGQIIKVGGFFDWVRVVLYITQVRRSKFTEVTASKRGNLHYFCSPRDVIGLKVLQYIIPMFRFFF